jgi:3-dehydroquinate synthase
MSRVRVPLAERSYDIVIEPGALTRWDGSDVPNEIAILSNHSVAPLYAEPLAQRLRDGGRKVLLCLAPDGEAHKSLEWTQRAYDALAGGGFTRRGVIVAVGGGVVGDWAGFVAATWMRGVDFIQIPTTLLAMVDSSVGGKTGVNHPRAKNLIGAFHQPRQVLIDVECLRTLPLRELRAGLAEVIKYGVIADAEFFAWLEEHIEAALQLDMEVLEHIITRSVEIKAEVVGEDERESDASGRRATLNYGHTVGHAIEATTEYGKYLHGEAIAIGMQVAARLALQQGTIAQEEGEALLQRQTRLFERAGLPTTMPPESTFEALWAAMALDKKSRGNQVNFILPTRLGRVETFQNIPAEAVQSAIEATRATAISS